MVCFSAGNERGEEVPSASYLLQCDYMSVWVCVGLCVCMSVCVFVCVCVFLCLCLCA